MDWFQRHEHLVEFTLHSKKHQRFVFESPSYIWEDVIVVAARSKLRTITDRAMTLHTCVCELRNMHRYELCLVWWRGTWTYTNAKFVHTIKFLWWAEKMTLMPRREVAGRKKKPKVEVTFEMGPLLHMPCMIPCGSLLKVTGSSGSFRWQDKPGKREKELPSNPLKSPRSSF